MSDIRIEVDITYNGPGGYHSWKKRGSFDVDTGGTEVKQGSTSCALTGTDIISNATDGVELYRGIFALKNEGSEQVRIDFDYTGSSSYTVSSIVQPQQIIVVRLDDMASTDKITGTSVGTAAVPVSWLFIEELTT